MGFYLNKRFIKIKMVATNINRPNQKATEYIIPDADIMPMSHIRKHLKNPQNNAELSGKKKRKVLKRLRRQQPALFEQRVGKMEIEAEVEADSKAEAEEKTKDVEMAEAE